MASGWREFPTIAIDFFCKLRLSENFCCCNPLLPILHSHPAQHPRWVWYVFQAAHGNGGGQIRQQYDGQLMERIFHNRRWFFLQTKIVWKLLLPRPSPPNITGPPCTLLNPLFGNEKIIVVSGSMFEGWYFKAWQNLLQKIKDVLHKNNPLLCYTLSDNSSSEGVRSRVAKWLGGAKSSKQSWVQTLRKRRS